MATGGTRPTNFHPFSHGPGIPQPSRGAPRSGTTTSMGSSSPSGSGFTQRWKPRPASQPKMNPPGEPWQPAHQWATTGDLSEIFPGGGSATYVRDDAFGNPVYVDDDGNEIRAARPGSGKYQAAGAPYEEIGDTNWIRPSPSPSPSGGSGVGDLLPEPDMFRRSREGLTPLQSYLQYEKGKEYLQRQRRRGIQGILNAISNAAYHSSKMAGNEGSSYTGPTLRRGPFGVKSGYIGGSY